MLKKQHVCLVRHAKMHAITPFLGRTDQPVDAESNRQLAQRLSEPFDQIISSPLQRCAVLAHELVARDSVPVAWLDELQERHWGEWDGVSPADIDPQNLQAYYDAPFEYAIPQAESFAQMQTRVHQAWWLITQCSAQSLLCITHGGVMRHLMQSLFGLPNAALFQLKLEYGAQIHLEVTHTDQAPFVQLVEIRPGNL